MIRLLIIFVLTCSFSNLNAQAIRITGLCDTSGADRVREAALKLTSDFLQQTVSPLNDSIRFVDSSYIHIYKELSAFYHSQDSIKSIDTILRLQPDGADSMVPAYVWSLHQTIVTVDTSFTWAGNLVKGIFPTGNDTLDNLISNYHISYFVTWQSPSPNIFKLTFSSSDPLNPNAWTYQLSHNITGILSAQPQSTSLGDDAVITREDSGFYSLYKFKYAFGDCNPGCTNHSYWTFRIYRDCSIEQTDRRGDAVPYYLAIGDLSANNLIVGPNPSINHIYLNQSLINISLTITDLTGRICPSPHTDRDIDISSLPAGVYTLRLQSRDAAIFRRFVKE